MDWLRSADATKGSSTLTAIIGAIPSCEPESQDIGDRLEEFTRLDANIKVAGDPDTIREAQCRWTIDQPPSSIALKVRRLSQSYDNWFLLVNPLSAFAATAPDVAGTTVPPLKYRNDLIDAVEEISGGVRFGMINHSPAILVDAIEDLIIYAEGTRVTISLRIPEDRARSLLDAQQ